MKLVNKEWFFSRHVRWTSRFNMMTINEILSELLREPRKPQWFLRHLLFLQVETLPSDHEIIRWDSLSLRCIPVPEWILGIRSLFLIISSFFGSSFAFSPLGYVPDASNFSNSSISFPNSTREQRMSWKNFTKSSFILRFPVCTEVLVISQTAIAFHRIQPPLIIRSRLQ